MYTAGKTLIVSGIILIVAGVMLAAMHKWPFLFRLPGDILIQKKNVTIYFPLATSILVSVIFSLIFWLWPRR